MSSDKPKTSKLPTSVGKDDIDSLFQLSEKSSSPQRKPPHSPASGDSSDSVDNLEPQQQMMSSQQQGHIAANISSGNTNNAQDLAATFTMDVFMSSTNNNGLTSIDEIFNMSANNLAASGSANGSAAASPSPHHRASAFDTVASSTGGSPAAAAPASASTSSLSLTSSSSVWNPFLDPEFTAPNIRRTFRICRKDNFAMSVFTPETPQPVTSMTLASTTSGVTTPASSSAAQSPAGVASSLSPASSPPSKMLSSTAAAVASSAPDVARQTLLTAPIVQIPAMGLQDIFQSIENAKTRDEDQSHLPMQTNAKLSVEPHAVLPSAFDMPLRLRCDFCQKVDSMCYHCHKKWREVEQPHRRNAVLARLNEIPEGARTALFFSSCARGSIDFVKLVLQGHPNAVKWMTELHPTKLDLAVYDERKDKDAAVRDAWDDLIVVAHAASGKASATTAAAAAVTSPQQTIPASGVFIASSPETSVDVELLPPPKTLRPGLLRFCGRHSALHVAVAYDNIDVAQVLLQASQSLVRSERKILASQLLPEDTLQLEQQQKAALAAIAAAPAPRDGESMDGDALTSLARDHQLEQEELKRQQAAGGEKKDDGAIGAAASAAAEDRDRDDYVPKSLRNNDEENTEETPEQRVHRWHEIFTRKPQIAELILANKARRFRTLKQYEEADNLYKRLLKQNPRNENALCGRAKMFFDRGMLDECIAQCRDVLQLNMYGGVQWIDFDVQTVHYLMENALRTIHERAHAIHGTALKSCGCIYTDRVRLRRFLIALPQKLVCTRIAPYADIPSAFALWRAFAGARVKRGLLGLGRGLNRTLQQIVSMLPPIQLTQQLYGVHPDIANVINRLRQFLPSEDPAQWLPPFVSRGFSVVAFCDFNKIMLRAIVQAINPVFKKTMFAKSRGIQQSIAVVKEFTMKMQPLEQRALGDEKPPVGAAAAAAANKGTAAGSGSSIWELENSSAWEVDPSIIINEAASK